MIVETHEAVVQCLVKERKGPNSAVKASKPAFSPGAATRSSSAKAKAHDTLPSPGHVAAASSGTFGWLEGVIGALDGGGGGGGGGGAGARSKQQQEEEERKQQAKATPATPATKLEAKAKAAVAATAEEDAADEVRVCRGEDRAASTYTSFHLQTLQTRYKHVLGALRLEGMPLVAWVGQRKITHAFQASKGTNESLAGPNGFACSTD